VVRTPSGAIRCRRTIVAVDGRLEALLPELAGRVRTTRLQMLGTAPASDVDVPRPVYRRWGYDYWQQLPDRRIVLGGVRDEFADAEWTTDSTPTAAVQARLEQLLRCVVGTHAPVTNRWAASVSYSNTILPVLAETRRGVWAIGGYSGTGNVLGALYGRIVAQLAVTGTSGVGASFHAVT
jgi:glycine/D-amino acid oxidase-like deaminating enzyme